MKKNLKTLNNNKKKMKHEMKNETIKQKIVETPNRKSPRLLLWEDYHFAFCILMKGIANSSLLQSVVLFARCVLVLILFKSAFQSFLIDTQLY